MNRHCGGDFFNVGNYTYYRCLYDGVIVPKEHISGATVYQDKAYSICPRCDRPIIGCSPVGCPTLVPTKRVRTLVEYKLPLKGLGEVEIIPGYEKKIRETTLQPAMYRKLIQAQLDMLLVREIDNWMWLPSSTS